MPRFGEAAEAVLAIGPSALDVAEGLALVGRKSEPPLLGVRVTVWPMPEFESACLNLKTERLGLALSTIGGLELRLDLLRELLLLGSSGLRELLLSNPKLGRPGFMSLSFTETFF